MVDLQAESTAGRCATAPFRLKRELAFLGGALAFGLLLIPLLIWLAGHLTLGPYTHGDTGPGYGPLSLYGDFFSKLSRGQPVYWVVAIGPLALLLVSRLWLALIRRVFRD